MTGSTSSRTYLVSELADLARVTVRTLHHYDALGLLVPSARDPNGYRRYDQDDLLRLQQILVCREFGMPLERIRQLLDAPGFDRLQALVEQRAQIEKQIQGAHRILRSLDAAIETLKGESEMTPDQLFDGFNSQLYESEVKKRWGTTEAYKESSRRTSEYSKDDWHRIQSEDKELMERLAGLMDEGAQPTSRKARELALEHRLHIDRYYYPCSQEMHAQLAQMYTGDERFRANFDKYHSGLAAFLATAIQANLDDAS
jgi:DNA-binding transcriptional MerR regulator